MTDMDNKRELSPYLRDALAQLRRRIRWYVWVQGGAALIVLLGAAFWVGLAADWLLEPSARVRVVALTGVGLLAVWLLYRLVLSRAFTRLADTSMAILLEAHHRDFHDSLLTSVELAARPDRADGFNDEMIDHTNYQAVQEVRGLRLGSLFNWTPLVRSVAAAMIVVTSIVLFGWLARDAMAVYVNRLGLSQQRWPRRTRLIVEGFPVNAAGERAVKVARGDRLDLTILADNTLQYPPPQRVEVRFLVEDGSRGRGDARRIGRAAPGRDPTQSYLYTFTNIYESLTFDVFGGDDRVEGLRIEAVDSPEIIRMTLQCRYPKCTARGSRRLNVTGAMQIPQGTELRLHAVTNKGLRRVKILDGDAAESTQIDVSPAEGPLNQFDVPLGPLQGDRTLLFVLTDVDGIENRDPYRLSLSMVPDEAPQIAVGLAGVGTAITPSAQVRVRGKVTDDYGVNRVWFEHRVDEQETATTPLGQDASGQQEIAVDGVLDAAALNLKPQQKLLLGVKAADRFDLGGQPNIASSQRFLLEVVTPQQLRAMLERRELLLRKRFETIYDEMTETRDLTARIDFSTTATDSEAEEDDDPANAPPDEDGRLLARRTLRIVRAVQNVERAAHETLAVAHAFDEIRDELINNRIDTPELKKRLHDDIALPLREIGESDLARLGEELQLLQQRAGDPQAGPAQLKQTVKQADTVLLAMKKVLDRMLELESYNEVMELLRELIRDQDQLLHRTKDRRKEQLKRLLED